MTSEIINLQPFPSRNGQELVREANHRIANHLSILAGLVQMHLRELEKTQSGSDPRFILREVVSKIVALGHFHRHLADRPECEEIELGDFLIRTSGAIVAMLPPEKRVSVVYRLGGKCMVPPSVAHPFALLLSEIIMNAIKHAHPAGLRVVMTIACCLTAKDLTVEIADDGVGLPEDFDKDAGGGTGFQIIRALAKRADANLCVESDELGLCFRFTIPGPHLQN